MILKGMNTISSEISLQVLSKTTGTIEGNPGQSKEVAITNVKKQMWDLLVDRPYLYLQYGQDSKEKIGEERINILLDTTPGEERNKMVTDDVQKHKNFMMTNDSVGERMIFTIMYYIVNTFAGVPTIIICLFIVACQLLFMIMSIIGPIAMAFALIPQNRRVLISWAEQWLKPLALKVFLSLIVTMLFSISRILYELPEAGTSGYIMTMILQILVFVLCYIFRDYIKGAFRKSKVAYHSITNLEHMAGKTRDGYNRTMDGVNAGIEKAKDMFWDSTLIDIGEDSSTHAADDNKTEHAQIDEEHSVTDDEKEESQYVSIGKETDEVQKAKVNLGKESEEEQQQDGTSRDEEEQERATMGEENEENTDTEQEGTEEHSEVGHPEELASLEGIDEEVKQENPELSEVEGIEPLKQEDASEYEAEYEVGREEELATIGENAEESKRENPELSEVEGIDQAEQEDASEYEIEHEVGSEEELTTTGGIAEDSQQVNAEVSEVEAPEQLEQDNVAGYEAEHQEGTSDKIETPVVTIGQVVSQPNEIEKPIHSFGHDPSIEGGNEFAPGESDAKELASTKGLKAGTSVGDISTKALEGNQFKSGNPSRTVLTNGSIQEGVMHDTPIESSGDLAMTSADSLVTSGSMPSHSMSENGVEGQKVQGYPIEGGKEVQRQGASKEVLPKVGANPQGNTMSSPVTGTSTAVSQIESAREEVAVSEEIIVDATQERTELETIVEEVKEVEGI